jgi:hypothetical protein
MSKMKSLFQKAWTAVTNPGQDERVAQLIQLISRELQTQKQGFNLERVLQSVDCSTIDVVVATKQYYEKLLKLYWANGVPSIEKQKLLAFVARKLELKNPDIERMNSSACIVLFGAQLGRFLEDGIITDDELTQLEATSRFANVSVPQFVQRHLSSEGLGILRGVFANATETGQLEPKVWNNLISSAGRLGITKAQLQQAVVPLAKGFAEHVLADAKSDNLLSSEEETYLNWIVQTFQFDSQYASYFTSEIRSLRERTRIATGNLDSIAPPPGINLKSGEILYFCQTATARFVKQNRSGPVAEEHKGRLLLTENRLLFDSQTKSLSFRYKSIIAWKVSDDRITTQLANKPEITFFIPPGSEKFLNEKFKTIIELHSRMLRRKIEGEIDRHIPHDVRQRVWQRYGGRCVECGATDYLEFDHIIPVSRGGSNSEQNVQILCRKCNLAKSNKI